MFRAMFGVQWRWLRTPMLVVAAGALVAPVLALKAFGRSEMNSSPSILIARGETLGILITFLAIVAGLVAANVVWAADDRVGHGYALSLPITRRRYLWWRALGGLLVLGVPAFAVWLGALVALGLIEIPPSLNAYPTWFALRALAVMALAFALMFVFRFGMSRRARKIILLVIFGWFVGAVLEAEIVGGKRGPLQSSAAALFGPYSPLGILVSRWPLVDV